MIRSIHQCLKIHAIHHIYIPIHTHTHTHTCIHTYIPAACMHTYIHEYIHTYIHTYTHACVHACMHTASQPATPTIMYIYVCMYIHAYIYVCIQIVNERTGRLTVSCRLCMKAHSRRMLQFQELLIGCRRPHCTGSVSINQRSCKALYSSLPRGVRVFPSQGGI